MRDLKLVPEIAFNRVQPKVSSKEELFHNSFHLLIDDILYLVRWSREVLERSVCLLLQVNYLFFFGGGGGLKSFHNNLEKNLYEIFLFLQFS